MRLVKEKSINRKLFIFPAFLVGLSVFANTYSINTDNTEINKQYRAESRVTADQQTNKAKDINITRRIRQDILKEKNLSTYAKNVKIISVNGRVTLDGPVRSRKEQNRILKHAKTAAGAVNVTNNMTLVAR